MDNMVLMGLLIRRYPSIEVLHVYRGQRDGEMFQFVRFRGDRKRFLASGLVTERMFAMQSAHWRRCATTELGCGYSLHCIDETEDAWEFSVYSEATPRDGWGSVSFLTKKGLKEAQALLREIFATNSAT